MIESSVALRQGLSQNCKIVDPMSKDFQERESYPSRHENTNYLSDFGSVHNLISVEQRLDQGHNYSLIERESPLRAEGRFDLMTDRRSRLFFGASCIEAEIQALHNTLLPKVDLYKDITVTVYDDQEMNRALKKVIRGPTGNVVKRFISRDVHSAVPRRDEELSPVQAAGERASTPDSSRLN